MPVETATLDPRAQADAAETLLRSIAAQDRTRLYEHEVYSLIEQAGGVEAPRHLFIPAGADWPKDEVAALPGRKLVLKLVSPDVTHKTEARAVRIIAHGDPAIIKAEADRLLASHQRSARVIGLLLVEFVEGDTPGFGSELFVGIRATREFGPVIAAGLGGVDSEFLAQSMKPGLSAAKAVASEIDAEEFLALFRRTAAYEVIAGVARGHSRIVSDDELRRCFAAFLSLAGRFCVEREDAGPHIYEMEVNPFAFRDRRLVPLDGRGRLGIVHRASPPRPLTNVHKLFEPERIALLGVSSSPGSIGRVILTNLANGGFARDRLFVIKEGADSVDGVQCVPDLARLPNPVDLLIVTVAAVQLPDVIQDAGASGNVRSAILISGGAGETEGSEGVRRAIEDAIAAARSGGAEGPVFLGPNCLGVRSEPGGYDAFFIPHHKLAAPRELASRPVVRVALLSQSGAFIITRLSNLEVLRPALAISVGNQADLALSDFVRALSSRGDIDVIAVYAEGFQTLDGAAFLHAVVEATQAGKLVILYKAGRTSAGRSAAAGHTAAIAGDYDVCTAAAAEAGALVVDTFKEFEQLVELASAFHEIPVRGRRIGAMSNAGYETVGMADTIRGPRYQVQMAALATETRERLRAVLIDHKLERLASATNPLDLTPMAGESAYEDCARVLLDCDEVDALVVSVVPLTPMLKTTAEEIAGGGALPACLPRLLRTHRKPLIFVVDCGSLFDPLARAVRSAGIPVFRTCDQAIRSLGRYLHYRTSGGRST
ncbi:MAG: acetate--CoA ligase family protein [Phycisphaerae bacterium]